MYEEGKSIAQIEHYLEMEQKRAEELDKVDYYGGRSLKEARDEIARYEHFKHTSQEQVKEEDDLER